MSDLLGKTIGAYRIVDKLGEGGMAEVYKAYQPRLERYVALKFIRPVLLAETNFQARFEQEAKLLARLSHPHIVHVYDFGEEGQQCYLAMQYVAGNTLRRTRSSRATSTRRTVITAASERPPTGVRLQFADFRISGPQAVSDNLRFATWRGEAPQAGS